MSDPLPSDPHLQRIARWCGALTVALGAAVLLGWMLDWEPLKRVLPGLAAMKGSSAVLFVLTGAGILVLSGSDDRRFAYASTLGLGIAGLAGLVLFHLLFDTPWDPNLWFPFGVDESAGPAAGRMTPGTALSFFALGLALLICGDRRARSARLAAALTLVPAGAGLVALIGSLYSIQGLYRPASNTTEMAVHTALGLVAGAVGVFAANPRSELAGLLVSSTAGARMFRFLFPYAALALVILGWFRLLAESGGLIDPGQGTAAFVLGAVSVLGILLWNHARQADESELREEKAQRQRQEFVAMLAHELRNPLAAITNGAALLAHSELDERAARTRDMISRQSRHMARLVDGLLDLSRLTRGRIELHRQEVDLDALLSRILQDEARPILELQEQEVVREIASPLRVEGDPVRLGQVFWNLISNASRFAPAGSLIRIRGRENGDRDVIVSISDEGPGIAPEDRERVFEPFFQTERSLARSEGGLGIGLTLVRQIVELHGGTVTVDGNQTGSTFTVTLPKRHGRTLADSGTWG